MSEIKRYVGITIGPICDTLELASTPAGLWFASSMFSDITKRLCAKIYENGFSILSPYYEAKDSSEKNNGVGKYHDRIIFSSEKEIGDKLDKIIEAVKRETYDIFPESIEFDKNFLEKYIQINYIIKDAKEMEGKNCILELSPYLDALELMKTFPTNVIKNPIRGMLAGKENNQNIFIKNSKLFSDIEEKYNGQFLRPSKDSVAEKYKKNPIWTIEEIANNHNENKSNLKWKNYFAVVQADGDSMGEFLGRISQNNIDSEEESNKMLKKASEAFLSYDEAAADLISTFGGMCIYAGGDDLLFLAPIFNTYGISVFELCKNINEEFNKTVRNAGFTEAIPTISFGISIQYVKFPLYEALENARSLLFGVVKNSKETKNSITINLKKHSGQSLMLHVPHEKMVFLINMIKMGMEADAVIEESAYMSIIQTISKFRNMISVLTKKLKSSDNSKKIDREQFIKSWLNLFDNPGQDHLESILIELAKCYCEEILDESKRTISIPSTAKRFMETSHNLLDEDNMIIDEEIDVLINLLLLRKFLIEKEAN